MITRRTVVASAAALAFGISKASAEEWRTQYPEITMAVFPGENAAGVTERYGPFVAYLSKELGIKVNLRIANDCAALIEGQRSGNLQLVYYGPAHCVFGDISVHDRGRMDNLLKVHN
jgi:phosphonate transport system substrate-binding protein